MLVSVDGIVGTLWVHVLFIRDGFTEGRGVRTPPNLGKIPFFDLEKYLQK
jgi:hypothetical protein